MYIFLLYRFRRFFFTVVFALTESSLLSCFIILVSELSVEDLSEVLLVSFDTSSLLVCSLASVFFDALSDVLVASTCGCGLLVLALEF